MCGRFTIQYTWAEYHEALSLIPASAKGRNDPPRYNVAPTQDVGFVAKDRDGEMVVQDGRWWLVPFWAKEIPKYPLFNARSETPDTKLPRSLQIQTLFDPGVILLRMEVLSH